MDKPQLLDVGRLKAPAIGYGWEADENNVVIPAGETGTIVHEFDEPNRAYEIEVSNDQGETIAMLTLTADQFDVVWRVAEAVGHEVRA